MQGLYKGLGLQSNLEEKFDIKHQPGTVLIDV